MSLHIREWGCSTFPLASRAVAASADFRACAGQAGVWRNAQESAIASRNATRCPNARPGNSRHMCAPESASAAGWQIDPMSQMTELGRSGKGFPERSTSQGGVSARLGLLRRDGPFSLSRARRECRNTNGNKRLCTFFGAGSPDARATRMPSVPISLGVRQRRYLAVRRRSQLEVREAWSSRGRASPQSV